MRRTLVALAFFAAACAGQAHAQWAVFDSTNYANALRQYREVQQLYTTANQTRDQVIQTYNLARQMAQMPQNLYQRYSADFARWKTLSASDTYGNTVQWVSAVNTGDPGLADAGYRTAGIQLVPALPSALANLDERSQTFIKAQYATAELADGISVNALATLGEIRARSLALQRQIAALQSDSYSNDGSQQTQMAVLGKINSAALMQLRSQQDTNQILTTAALQQMLASKEQFDQQKRALNQAIYFQQNFPDSMGRVTSGMTQSMQSISYSRSR
jgi:hypothetical protein